MKARTVIACLLCMVVSPAFAQNNVLPAAPHLVVKGHATRDVLPDRFTIRMTVEAVDPKPDAARGRVQSHVASLLQAMKRAQALQDRVTATSLSIEPKTAYRKGAEEEVFIGTQVSRTLRATFGRAEDLQAFLGEVVTSNEVQINSVDAAVSRQEEIEAQLRAEAIATTRRKAEQMAQAYGAKIASLYGVSDIAPRFDYGIDAYDVDGDHVGGGSSELDRISVTGSRIEPEELEVGSVTLQADVYAVFLLAD